MSCIHPIIGIKILKQITYLSIPAFQLGKCQSGNYIIYEISQARYSAYHELCDKHFQRTIFIQIFIGTTL